MIKISILGYGGRGRFYANHCKNMQESYTIMSIIDNSDEKLALAKNDLGLNDRQLFKSVDDFCASEKNADYVFVCSQDKDHFEHATKLLNSGYNLLLEKPIACSIEECVQIAELAKKKGLVVNICHVLRYSSYYDRIKKIIKSGILGKIIAIEQVENVAYWHQAHSYVRGDWRRKDEATPMIIAKCCHDLDIAVFLADSKCKFVSSVGNLNYFRKENAPQGATEYCLGGCKAKDSCPYDCEKLYIKSLKHIPRRQTKSIWPQSRLMTDSIVTIPKLYKACKTTRYGKCVFLSDNDVVDYQNVNMIFENGIQSNLTMTAFSGKESYRQTRIRGALGELICSTKDPVFYLEIYGQKPKKIRTSLVAAGSHGGGDLKMLKALAAGKMDTNIELSIESHLIGFAAEESRLKNGEPIWLEDKRGV